jgi:23S rRNA pseudouridine1911/1915/1917 synthase
VQVLFEDNHLLAIMKPAGLATMGVAEDEPSLLAMARRYIKQKYAKPGNVYLGVMSRLDAPVSGVVLLARTSKAAARLTEQFKSRSVQKTYWAVVEGAIEPSAAELTDWVASDERHRKMHIVPGPRPDAREARLAYRLLRPVAGGSLLEIELVTGRKHQIRLQLAHRGFPIVGDRKYGAARKFPAGVALHARRLVVTHPVKADTPIELTAPLPASWKTLGSGE